jgi:hypothetical protein
MIEGQGQLSNGGVDGAGQRVIGECCDYDGLIAVLRVRATELRTSRETLDAIAGLPKGYISKLIGARPVRRIGMKALGELLGALGIKCVIVEDQQALERIRNRLGTSQIRYMRRAATHKVIVTSKFLRSIGRKGNRTRWKKMSPKARSREMRKLARLRWQRAGRAKAHRTKRHQQRPPPQQAAS